MLGLRSARALEGSSETKENIEKLSETTEKYCNVVRRRKEYLLKRSKPFFGGIRVYNAQYPANFDITRNDTR